MKRRCVPLRADHNLLTPDTHAVSGVRPHPVVQVRSEVAASLPGHLSDLSSSESAVRLMRQHPPATSPIRFLRFEDETETEAETRYLERQRRWVGQRGTGVLVSKPDLNLYVNGRAGPQGWGNVVDRQHREQTLVENLSLHLKPPVPEDRGRSLYRPHLNLRTEPIRETYIGSVTPGETNRRGSGERHVANNQVRRTNPMELSGNQVTFPQAMPTTDLPINPYAPSQLTTPAQPSDLTPPISKCSSSSPPSLMISQSIRLNGTNVGKNQKQNQEDLGTPAAAKPHRELQTGKELREMSPCVEEQGLHPRMKNSSLTSEITADSQSSPSSNSSSDGQVRQPVRKELHNDDTSLPEQ
ncbi:uncharacterized protein [Chaetodon trifascialis]|uniref:uncharacterized protein n=1 Tax=Chaetodon trifascialis TaxID=109706 RepID=UPI0039958DA1